MKKLGLLSGTTYIQQSATRSGMYSPDDNYALQSTKAGTLSNWRNLTYYWRLNLQSDTSSLSGVSWTPDGKGLWTCAATSGTNAAFRQYTVSTPFDCSTISLINTHWNSSGATTANYGSYIGGSTNPTGIYVGGDYVNVVDSAADAIFTYQLMEDKSSILSADLQSDKTFSIASQETAPTDIAFSSDGTKMYTLSDASNGIDEWALSTAWNITTASWTAFTSTNSQDAIPTAFFFKPDGTRLWVLGDTNDRIYEYDLSTAWDTTTLTYNSASALLSGGVASSQLQPEAMTWSSDGLSIIVYSANLRYLNKFTVSSAWSLSGFSFSTQSNSIASFITSTGQSCGIAYNSDGTRLTVVDSANDAVTEFSTSAYGVSVTRIGSFVVSDNVPEGVCFGDNGTKLYYVGSGSDNVYQYDLKQSYVSVMKAGVTQKSISAETTVPSGITFSSDGTKMWITDTVNEYILQYTCSTPFDGNTSTYDNIRFQTSTGNLFNNGVTTTPGGTFSVGTNPNGITIDSTGKYLFISTDQVDGIVAFFLPTPNALESWSGGWAYIAVPSNHFGTSISSISGLSLSSDGRTLLLSDNSTDDLLQLDLNF
jgi:DNA-binding beta-propeller fold protein YncE